LERTNVNEYDKEKYREMLLEAAETVLGYFGFSRTDYECSQKRKRKWHRPRHRKWKII